MERELEQEGVKWKGGTVSLRCSGSARGGADDIGVQDPEDDVLLPPQDFSSITRDESIGVVLMSFQMRSAFHRLLLK